MKQKGFTLIELLIVVAIIGILAAIAVPNFVNALTRAKVARVQADMQSIGTSLETYQLDNNAYPPIFPPVRMADRFIPLTTPVSYMSSILLDPFNPDPTNTAKGPKDGNNPDGNYDYWTRLAFRGNTRGSNYWDAGGNFPAGRFEWMLISFGPAESWVFGLVYPAGHLRQGEYVDYNQSNGLISRGGIVRYGG